MKFLSNSEEGKTQFYANYYSTAQDILDVVEKNYVPSMQNVVIDGVKIEPPKPLPWYPDNLGWQVNAPRLVIKKSPEFQKFHKFMVTETEAVSSPPSSMQKKKKGEN
jgi:hypothetical protein